MKITEEMDHVASDSITLIYLWNGYEPFKSFYEAPEGFEGEYVTLKEIVESFEKLPEDHLWRKVGGIKVFSTPTICDVAVETMPPEHPFRTDSVAEMVRGVYDAIQKKLDVPENVPYDELGNMVFLMTL
ncbi:MAG: hypothetical protein ACE5FT_03960 [Candidatus Nanoarchaeia archaeon]